MLTGFLHDGRKFMYDLPEEINDIRKLYHLATGSNYVEGQRAELFGLPKLRGYNGPMYNGTRFLPGSDEKVVIIRYEKPEKLEFKKGDEKNEKEWKQYDRQFYKR